MARLPKHRQHLGERRNCQPWSRLRWEVGSIHRLTQLSVLQVATCSAPKQIVQIRFILMSLVPRKWLVSTGHSYSFINCAFTYISANKFDWWSCNQALITLNRCIISLIDYEGVCRCGYDNIFTAVAERIHPEARVRWVHCLRCPSGEVSLSSWGGSREIGSTWQYNWYREAEDEIHLLHTIKAYSLLTYSRCDL